MQDRISGDEIRQSVSATRDTGVQFMIADVELALTMLDFANVASNAETARRSRRNAQDAYESVQRLLARVTLHDDQRLAVEKSLEVLGQRLRQESDSSR
jgi:hypothetical protein